MNKMNEAVTEIQWEVFYKNQNKVEYEMKESRQ